MVPSNKKIIHMCGALSDEPWLWSAVGLYCVPEVVIFCSKLEII